MINFDNYANETKTKHNSNWRYVPDHPYKMFIAGGSGSRKTNSLLNLIHYQPDVDNIYIYIYIYIYMYIYIYIWNFFMEYSNDMQDVYINIEEHNPGKNLKC